MKQSCVYILSSKRNGTLYVGVTSNLVQRVWQHKSDLIESFILKVSPNATVYMLWSGMNPPKPWKAPLPAIRP